MPLNHRDSISRFSSLQIPPVCAKKLTLSSFTFPCLQCAVHVISSSQSKCEALLHSYYQSNPTRNCSSNGERTATTEAETEEGEESRQKQNHESVRVRDGAKEQTVFFYISASALAQIFTAAAAAVFSVGWSGQTTDQAFCPINRVDTPSCDHPVPVKGIACTSRLLTVVPFLHGNQQQQPQHRRTSTTLTDEAPGDYYRQRREEEEKVRQRGK